MWLEITSIFLQTCDFTHYQEQRMKFHFFILLKDQGFISSRNLIVVVFVNVVFMTSFD